MDFPFYLFCVYCLSRIHVFLLNSHFLFNNLSRGSGFFHKLSCCLVRVRRILYWPAGYLMRTPNRDCIMKKTGAASMLRKIKKMQLTLTLNFSLRNVTQTTSNNHCCFDRNTTLSHIRHNGMLTQFNYPHLQDNVCW